MTSCDQALLKIQTEPEPRARLQPLGRRGGWPLLRPLSAVADSGSTSGAQPGRRLSTGGLETGPVAGAAPARRFKETDVEAEFSHLPVMVREVVELLLPVPAGLFVDCTVGGAGHSAALLDARSDLRLLGIDRDAEAVAAARLRLGPFGVRAQVVQGG